MDEPWYKIGTTVLITSWQLQLQVRTGTLLPVGISGPTCCASGRPEIRGPSCFQSRMDRRPKARKRSLWCAVCPQPRCRRQPSDTRPTGGRVARRTSLIGFFFLANTSIVSETRHFPVQPRSSAGGRPTTRCTAVQSTSRCSPTTSPPLPSV